MTIEHLKVNGNSRNGYHTVRADLRDLVKDLITVDELRCENLRQLTSLRADVYRQARQCGIPPAVLRAIVHRNQERSAS